MQANGMVLPRQKVGPLEHDLHASVVFQDPDLRRSPWKRELSPVKLK